MKELYQSGTASLLCCCVTNHPKFTVFEQLCILTINRTSMGNPFVGFPEALLWSLELGWLLFSPSI